MNRFLPLLLAGGLLLTGCQLSLTTREDVSKPSGTDTGFLEPPAGTLTTNAGDTSGSFSHAATKDPSGKGAAISKPLYPTFGILSDPKEYSPGNPMTHSPSPLLPDLSELTDKTGEGFDQYREKFQEYLRQVYPEQEFRLVNIMNYQAEGKTYKEASAWSQESLDIVMKLYYDGTTVTDSFQRDVINRQNTMNRWRKSFRYYLDKISSEVAPVHDVALDVSYDYYEENIPKITLDAPLEPESQEYTRCLEMYFARGSTAAELVADTAAEIYQAMALQEYKFQEYFIYLEEPDGTRRNFQVPLRIVGTSLFIPEMLKALAGDSPGNLIQPIKGP